MRIRILLTLLMLGGIAGLRWPAGAATLAAPAAHPRAQATATRPAATATPPAATPEAADLTISLAITLRCPGDILQVTATVYNDAYLGTGPFVVEVNGARQSVPHLGRYETVQLDFPNVAPKINIGIVDVDKQVNERSEYNNQASVATPVFVAPPVCGTPSPTPSLTPTPTLIPTRTPTLTPTPTPPPVCQVRYTIQSQWQSGFVADVTVTNLSAAAISGWELAWAFYGNQRISTMWNALAAQTGASVSARNADWNATIAAGGQANFGFQASYSGANNKPASFTLNGKPCAPDPASITPTPMPTITRSPTPTPR